MSINRLRQRGEAGRCLYVRTRRKLTYDRQRAILVLTHKRHRWADFAVMQQSA